MAKTYQARLKHIGKLLNELLADARRDHRDANLYLAMETIHLMTGRSHEGFGDRPRPDRSIASVLVPGFGGGDW